LRFSRICQFVHRARDGGELHAIVGGIFLATGEFLLLAVGAQDRGPGAGAWIGPAAAVAEDGYAGNRFIAHEVNPESNQKLHITESPDYTGEPLPGTTPGRAPWRPATSSCREFFRSRAPKNSSGRARIRDRCTAARPVRRI